MKLSTTWPLALLLVLVVVMIDKGQATLQKEKITYDDVDFYVLNVTGKFASLERCGTVKPSEINSAKHLNGDRRYKFCELAFAATGHKFTPTDERKFFDPNENSLALINQNPCHLICFEKHESDPTSYHRDSQEFRLVGFPCGDNHVCNDKGCCVLHEPPTETPTTEPETETPTPEPETEPPTTEPETEPPTPEPETEPETEPPTTEPETEPPTPEPETEPPTTEPETEPPTTEPETEPPTPEPETETPTPDPVTTPHPPSLFKCKRAGYFMDHVNNQTYHYCTMIVTVEKCGVDEIFSSRKKKCSYNLATFDPSLEFYQWADAIKCTKAGIFRSPYNCRYFYACLPQSEGFLVYFGFCYGDKVFDEERHTCRPKQARCHNVLKVDKNVAKDRTAGGQIYRLQRDPTIL